MVNRVDGRDNVRLLHVAARYHRRHGVRTGHAWPWEIGAKMPVVRHKGDVVPRQTADLEDRVSE